MTHALGSMLAASLASAVLHAADREAVVDMGPHQQTILQISEASDGSGGTILTTNSYVQVETGLNFRDDYGAWVPSVAGFDLIQGGATAWRGQHKVSLAANLNAAGSVQVRLPDNQVLRSHPYALAWYDTATGESVLIGEIQDCRGYQVADDQIIYPGAFTDIEADIRYTFSKAGFEQDVILREQPPTPETFGLRSETSRLEVWTEFPESPEPQKRSISKDVQSASVVAGELTDDEVLDFGSAQIGTGRAFDLSKAEESLSLVVKHWIRVEQDRSFLVEAVSLKSVEDSLRTLPEAPEGAWKERKPSKRLQAMRTTPKKPAPSKTETAEIRRVRPGSDDILIAQVSRPGLVMDYLTLNTSQANYTFASDETYHVTGAVILTGTTTFEGGAVIKLDTGTSARLEVQGPLNFGGAPYKPVVFTADDDTTVGETIAGAVPGNLSSLFYGSGSGSLTFNNANSINLKYARFNHLRRALSFTSGASLVHSIWHAQFVRCQEGLAPANTVNLRNVLFNNVTKVLAGTAATVNCQHVSANVGTHFNFNNAATLSFVNSLVVQVTTLGNTQTGFAPDTASSGAAIFQSASGGNHYLLPTSPYRNVGSTSIDSTLGTELRAMTTEAPQVLTGTIALDTTLFPRVARDTDTPDKGYHYTPLDYVLKQVATTQSLRLTNGVAVAVAGTHGVDLQSGGKLISEGRPENLNRISRWHNVQEQSASEGNGGPMTKITANYGSGRPVIQLRFTELSALSKSGAMLLENGYSQPFNSLTLEFCQSRNVGVHDLYPVDGSAETVILRNNLFERARTSINKSSVYSANTPLTVDVYNNLFWRGTVMVTYDNGSVNPTWTFKDNLFDGTSQVLNGSGWSTYILRTHNGFTIGTATNYNGSNGKTGLSTDYQINGTWGNRYYPASGAAPSLASLIDTGSRTRESAGLYHFTVKSVATTKEGADIPTTVDVGFHYVGLSGSGMPNDYDGDGLPDYFEDRNGNNAIDSGETHWQVSNGALGAGGGLIVFTPLN